MQRILKTKACLFLKDRRYALFCRQVEVTSSFRLLVSDVKYNCDGNRSNCWQRDNISGGSGEIQPESCIGITLKP